MINIDETPELNITPLVDIMLVLLAILMVTTPTIVYEEQILLPDGSKTKTSSAQKLINSKAPQPKNLNRYLLFYNTALIFAPF